MSDQVGTTSGAAAIQDVNTSSQEATQHGSGNEIIVIQSIAKDVGIPDKEYARFERFVRNAMSTRMDIIKHYIDPRRDLDQECGFPKEIASTDYDAMFARDPIAARAVEVMDKEAWRVHPDVYETEDKKVTKWEQANKDMIAGLMGRKSYFGDDVSAILWNYFKDACVKSKLHRYAIVFYGLDDKKRLDQPVIPREGMKLKYLRVFTETQATISAVDEDEGSPRYNQPIEYEVSFTPTAYYGDGVTVVGTDSEGDSKKIHYTRVQHICMEDVFHMPVLQQIFNCLLGLGKLYAGAPEMYWRGAFPGLAIESDPSLGGEIEDYDPAEMKTMLERYMNGLQRYLALNGFTAKSLAPQVVDPTPQIACLLKAIWIKLGVPQRVGEGTEEGKLAGGQDKMAHNGRVNEYQTGYVTPRVIMPFYDTMIAYKVLPEPKDPLHCKWPKMDSMTAEERSTIALKVAQAIGQFVSTGGDALITPFWFLTEVLGWEGDKAQKALDDMAKEIESLQTMKQVSADIVPEITGKNGGQGEMKLPEGQGGANGNGKPVPVTSIPGGK